MPFMLDTTLDFKAYRSRSFCREITVTVSEEESLVIKHLPDSNELVVLQIIEGQADECVYSILKP